MAILRHCSMYADPTDKWDQVYVWCPACDDLHGLPVTGDGSKRPMWGWNGSLTDVTLTPSILSKYGVIDGVARVCHSYLTNGRWQFLEDCTHALAGQTVPMVPLPDWIYKEAVDSDRPLDEGDGAGED